MAKMPQKKKLDRDDIQSVDPGNLNITSVRGKHEKKRREKISKEEKALRRQKKREERRKIREQKREQRRLARIRRKEEKKRMKPVLYDPEKVEAFSKSVFIGFALRFFAIAFSVFGVCYMFCDSFAITPSTSSTGEGVSGILLLLFCYAITCAFSLIFMGKMCIFAGVGIILFTLLMIFVFAGNPVAFFLGGFEQVFNHVMYVLDSYGYASFPMSAGFPVLDSLGAMYFGGVAGVAMVLSLIFSAFSSRRTRIFPMIIAGGAVCALCFSYNFSNSNVGIAFTLAGVCSTVVLATHDKLYAKLKKSRKSRAFSGYSSALAGLLALIIAIMPATSVSKPFVEIEFLSEPIGVARAYFMTLLTGGNPKNNVMNSLVEERPVELDPPEFTNAHLFTVKSYTKKNIYLRSWIASDYNDKDDSWSVLSDDDYALLTEHMKGSSVDRNFTGDEITYRLYEMFGGDLISQLIAADEESVPEQIRVMNNKYSYTASLIDIEYVENSGVLYVLPQSYVPSAGLLEFESRYEKYHQTMDVYSDGMYESSWFNLFKKYTAVAVIQDYTSAGYAQNTDLLVKYYKAIGEFILTEMNKYRGDDAAALEAFRQKLVELDLYNTFGSDNTFQEYLALNSNDRVNWYRRYYTTADAYTEYVMGKYLTTSESASIDQITEIIRPEFEYQLENGTYHDAILTVVRYLINNYTYSLTPAIPSGEYESDLDAFLLETKEGYCVQFATAATLILRELGVPSRYVQGYIADNAEKSEDAQGNTQYVYEVIDDQAHAWVEVYVDGLGWRTYEVTPGYFKSMYYVEPTTRPNPDDTTTNNTTPPETTTTIPEDDETTIPDVGDEEIPEEPKFEIDWEVFFKTLGIVALAVLIFLFLRHKIKIAHRIHDNRKYFIQRAIYGTFEDKADMDLVAITIGDCIYDVLSVAGFERSLGEMPSEFAARVDDDPEPEKKSKKKLWRRRRMLSKSMVEISELISKQEFGNGVTREELDVLGTYLQERIKVEYKALSPIKKIWYRYIKYMI